MSNDLSNDLSNASTTALLEIFALGFPWQTLDPFLFCVYHEDFYPAGNDKLGPAASLQGREIGMDFTIRDGWRMYHGDEVPGFPGHPHRGFETVTAVVQGCIDHADSMGASGRYGAGDVQWMTAGKGVQHAEMFPLLHPDRDNTQELFQIWLNLPKASKFAEPYYGMIWSESVPEWKSAAGDVTVRIIAGELDGLKPPAPPPDSWAARPENEVAIWTISLEPGAKWSLPPASPGLSRVLYYYKGQGLQAEGTTIPNLHGMALDSGQPVLLVNGEQPAKLLLLQGKPIGERVVQYGPFVMSSEAEIQQAFADYQRTQFGGWPWPSNGPVMPREQGRFARYADGRYETPGDAA